MVWIPLALNAPTGDWKLRVTDVATGKAATAGFRVDPRLGEWQMRIYR
ncbi:MAG: hypothetical protein H8E44_05670 [Planctomycetes bacterium]|nr:hypothetical protein [Planctomycetota bacterium]MBL7037003.1 hypothetical protein [Pirellulaceae bacterium]